MAPRYPASMQAVPFPTGAAEAAKVACEQVATVLGDHLEARAGLAATARDGWEGRYRDEFDDTWGDLGEHLAGLKEGLQLLAGRIADASAAAASINGHRAELRADWDTTDRPAGTVF